MNWMSRRKEAKKPVPQTHEHQVMISLVKAKLLELELRTQQVNKQ